VSGTTTPTPAPATTTRGTPETLQSQTFIVTVLLILLVGATVFGVFMRASQEVVSTISSLVIGGTLTGIIGYYYNATKHRAETDAPPTTTTVTGTPPTVTTTTGATQ